MVSEGWDTRTLLFLGPRRDVSEPKLQQLACLRRTRRDHEKATWRVFLLYLLGAQLIQNLPLLRKSSLGSNNGKRWELSFSPVT